MKTQAAISLMELSSSIQAQGLIRDPEFRSMLKEEMAIWTAEIDRNELGPIKVYPELPKLVVGCDPNSMPCTAQCATGTCGRKGS